MTEEINLGKCQQHDRLYEGFCKGCEVVICPSCVMFGNHKKHDVLSFKQGAMYIRRAIDNAMEKGHLKKEFSEGKILTIHENELILEKSRTETVQNIEEKFKNIVRTLYQRRDYLINEINLKFEIQKQKIDDSETDWCCKEDISKKLTLLSEDKNDALLLANSKFILDGIRKLNEKIGFCELEIYNNIDTNLTIEIPCKMDEDNNDNTQNVASKNSDNSEGNNNNVVKREYSVEEVVDAFENYMSFQEPKILNYKA